ncbi:SDR family oxidoreductase [Myceligenerans cantabricum]
MVSTALEHGHEVAALVRRAGAFEPREGLTEVVWTDLADQQTLARAFTGADAVISALGGAEKGPTSVCTDAMRSAVPAMGSAGVSRLVVVSAHGVLESRDRSLYSLATWAGVAERLKDKESMEPLVTGSDLDWTIVRPPALTDSRATGRYEVGDRLPIRLWHSISRADLAAFVVGEATDPRFVRGYPRIHR